MIPFTSLAILVAFLPQQEARFTIGGDSHTLRGFTFQGQGPDAFAQQPPKQRAWLGVSLQNSDGNVEVLEVVAGSPAERARLRAGDRIVSLGGDQLDSYDELVAMLEKRSPGAQVEVVLERVVQVRLDDEHKDGDRFLLGVYIGEPIDKQADKSDEHHQQDKQGAQDNHAQARGAWVTQVTPGYPATRAGLAAGDRLLSIEGVAVEDSGDLIDALAQVEEARAVDVRIERTRQVALGANPEARAVQPFERVAPRSPEPPAASAPPAPNAALEEELRALSRELRELREQVARLRSEIDRLRER